MTTLQIEYKKGCENTAAGALSRVHPVREGSSSADANEAGVDLETELPDIEIINAPGERELKNSYSTTRKSNGNSRNLSRQSVYYAKRIHA